MDNLTKKDVAIVIASYNRPEEVDRTLKMMIVNKNIPGKIFVVDQSKHDKTKSAVSKYKKKLPVEYIHSNLPSSAISKNIGIKKARDKYRMVLILDDDVDLLPGYFDEALKEFNKNPKLMALGGIDTGKFQQNREAKGKKLTGSKANTFLKLFFLPYKAKNSYKITSPYGYTIDPKPSKIIRDAEWLPGFNELFRSQVFDEYLCPKIKGGNVLEDIDSSYYAFKKFGAGSVMINPNVKADHRASQKGKDAEKRRIFVNHEDHFYFYYTYLNNFSNTLKMIWSMIGFFSGLIIIRFAKPTNNNKLNLKYNWEALKYCIKHRKEIAKCKMRKFLDENMQMKF